MPDQTSGKPVTAGQRLRDLLNRKNSVLPIFGVPNALHAKIMEACGLEAGFVGGAGTAGNYTGFSNTSMASMQELVMIGGYVARSVQIPMLLDGDTGPASLTALERMVEDAIRAGLAGIRFEDQPSGRKLRGDGYVEVVPREEAVGRLQIALEVRDRLDPTFVIAAKTYARKANNGGLQEAIDRLNLYREAGVDSVHFQHAQSVKEVEEVRAKVKGGWLAFVQGPRMTMEEHQALNIPIAWFTNELDRALRVTAIEFCNAFQKEGVAALNKFEKEHATGFAELKAMNPLSARREKELRKKFAQ